MGYIVSAQGVSVQAGKIQAVKEWPQPHNITKLQQFLGLRNYYRCFIRQQATAASPLTDVLRQKGSFSFGLEQERAFQKQKNALTQAPVLTIFDPALPRRVLAYTSGFALGAILEQLVNGNWHPVEYLSKRLSDVESRWSATQREILGCILALERLRPYLIGQPFEIITDHALLQFFTSQLKLSKSRTRWLESLADFQPTFIFKRGKLHAAPDALSRLPALNSIRKGSDQQALHEAVLIAQQNSRDQEFLNFIRLASQANSGFALKDGVVTKMVGNCQCIVLPGDAIQVKRQYLMSYIPHPSEGIYDIVSYWPQ